MTDPGAPPTVRRLRFKYGDALIVRCPLCGCYAAASDAQLAGEARLQCPSFLCRADLTKDWRPEIPVAE